ncbi:sensor histidine kinase [Salibacterium salarium]|uniref:histidine kinase n=1 Tax=Salibacterium salarium TaxID=284579 RepID=A0A428N8S2_9BACI|nr:HAMP domain-containing sensor histidine kinase [Salibacterium salarium]RSL34750.1 sensor histidine kinase [Salibacterium salarium]
MKIRAKIILLLLLNLFILFNVIYLSFALINSLSFDLIPLFSDNPQVQNAFSEIIKEYHTLIIFTLVVVSYIWAISNPLIHILEWIVHLAKDRYIEPMDSNGIPRSLSKRKGKLKYSYVFFKSILNNLQYLTNTLKVHKENEKELDKLKKAWVADIAHDLKTPLSYIKGYSSMLSGSNQWTEQERKKFLLKIEEKAYYMESLLLDLNNVFEFERASIDIHTEQVDLVSFVREEIIDFANTPIMEKYHVKLIDNLECPFMYTFDPSLIRRVLQNLLTNAVLHNSEGTNVQVSISRDDLFVVLEVKDDGKGMEQETIRQLYSRKNKGEATNSNFMPRGLGIPIVKQFIEAHDGNMSIESEIGQGTSVKLYLPLSK